MKRIIYITLFLFQINSLGAQDTLYKVDDSLQIVRILMVNETQIKYKLFSDPEGPTYVISRQAVARIIYRSGFIEDFSIRVSGDMIPVLKIDPRITDFRRNFIAVDALDLIKKTLTVSYEHIFKSGELGLQIPVSMRWNPEEEVYSINDFSVGFNVNLYPFGQSPTNRSSLYFGPSITYRHYDLKYSNMPSQGAMELIFNGGYLLRPFKYLNLAITGGVGWKEQFPAQSYISFSRGIIMRGGVQLGIKF